MEMEMANNCCVGIQIVTCNADCGEYLYDHLKVAKMAADAEKTGLYIGCRERRRFRCGNIPRWRHALHPRLVQNRIHGCGRENRYRMDDGSNGTEEQINL